MKKLLFLLTLALPLAIFSCEKSGPIEPEIPYDENHEATITVNRAEYETKSDSVEFTWRVKSTYMWKIQIPEEVDWITCDPMEGDSSDSFTHVRVKVAENTDAEERSTRISVVSGKAKKYLKISQARKEKILSEGDVDVSKIYIPQELRSNDFYRSSSKWYYGRSRQSEHFIVFWMSGKYWDEYGDITPSDAESSTYKVDIEDLLEKAEEFYDININKLKFADIGEGKSYLDKYKMMIFLNYQTEWLATGSGYDNTIGALWVSPNTCQPVGSTIAHEIGHSFQYQVYCDHILNGGTDDDKSGWRYGFGANGNGGNAFWEQTAQWQSFQPYPGEIFYNYYFNGYLDCAHLHIFHEDPRYSNYFIHSYWTHEHGIEEVATLWKESYYPEDPAETYMRLHDMTVSEFNDDIFNYARRMVTWDVDDLRDLGKNYIGNHTWKYTKEGDYYKVSKDKCPQSTGYNVITLTVPAAGKEVVAEFEGLTNDADYNIFYPAKAGWRYGFVAYSSNGARTYSEIYHDEKGEARFTIPSGCTKLWFVVTGAPTEYIRHAWDDDYSNDEQWPYKVKFTGVSVK